MGSSRAGDVMGKQTRVQGPFLQLSRQLSRPGRISGGTEPTLLLLIANPALQRKLPTAHDIPNSPRCRFGRAPEALATSDGVDSKRQEADGKLADVTKR